MSLTFSSTLNSYLSIHLSMSTNMSDIGLSIQLAGFNCLLSSSLLSLSLTSFSPFPFLVLSCFFVSFLFSFSLPQKGVVVVFFVCECFVVVVVVVFGGRGGGNCWKCIPVLSRFLSGIVLMCSRKPWNQSSLCSTYHRYDRCVDHN